MIVEFVVENFRSIKDEQVFSLVADGSPDDHKENYFSFDDSGKMSILKTAVVYGANASGKSNLLLGLGVLRGFILGSSELKIDQDIHFFQPFQLDVESEDRPTLFEIEFIAPDLYDESLSYRYGYKVVYNREFVEKEELFFYKTSKSVNIFKRTHGNSIVFGEYLKGAKRTIENITRDNQLFLSVAGNSKDHALNVIYRYFRDFIFGETTSDQRFTHQQMTGDDSSYYIELVGRMLKSADTGIQGVCLKGLDQSKVLIPDSENIPKEIMDKIKQDLSKMPHATHVKYNGEDVVGTEDFVLLEESSGTIKLFSVAGPVLHVLKKGGTLVVDEISTSLHPYITKYLIELFNSNVTNPKNAQLLFSTHDASILSSDIFRRDQVWFTEKDVYGATSLYSLLEFGKEVVRSNTNFSSWYMRGKLGAVPFVDHNLFNVAIEEECDG